MTELDNIWNINGKHRAIQNKIIEQFITAPKMCQFIYRPARLQHCMFYYNMLYYYYHNIILSLKNGATLDDVQLFVNNYWKWCFNQTKIPITFKEFMNNRSLSRYIQKASKEVNYGNSNRNRNYNCK